MDKNPLNQRLSASSRQQLFEKHNHTCQLCGTKDAPLETAAIIAISDGGKDEIENFTVLCPNCHRTLDSFQPREIEFTYFLRDILAKSRKYTGIAIEHSIGRCHRERADLIAIREKQGKKQRVLIETKSKSFFRGNQIQQAIAQINHYRSLAPFDAVALAFPGRLLERDKTALKNADIEVWDLDYVAEQFLKEINELPISGYKHLYSLLRKPTALEPSAALLKRLSKCQPGKRGWVDYQHLIRDIFEFLFSPPLGQPIWESRDLSESNRRDIIFPNYASDGFWKFLRESYNADFIIIDPKNHKGNIKKAQTLQIANYLKPHGAGMFAIIACRTGGDTGCITTIREQWAAHRKLIILLTDDDIKAMLLASSSRGEPEKVIGQIIQEFRLSM